MHGFKLTEQATKEGFSGGTVNAGVTGAAFDIAEGLKQGDGVIYTDDDLFAQVLASYPALERVPEEEVPSDAVAVPTPGREAVVAAPSGGPWVSQSGGESALAATQENLGEGEIPAEHGDEPGTEQAAVAAGEAVSGEGEKESSDAGEQPGETPDASSSFRSASSRSR